MMQSQILLCAVPQQIWQSEASESVPYSSLQALIQDALDVERRLPKNVNIENERTRYTLCCQQIESIALQFASSFQTREEFQEILRKQRFPSFAVDESYLHFLFQIESLQPSRSVAKVSRLGSSFYPPSEVASHHSNFALLAREIGWQDDQAIQMRERFFQLAASGNCGVIEVQVGLTSLSSAKAIHGLQAVKQPKTETWVDSTSIVAEVVHGSRRDQMTHRLKEQIGTAIQTNTIVNMSNQPHDVTTDVLHDFVYIRGNEHPTEVRVVYADGSEAKPFPLYCLPKRSDQQILQLTPLSPINIALISMRHLALDRTIDITWFRNRDASKSRTLSEADQFCYEYSLNQFNDLNDLARRTGGLQVHLYHTGFEPAVIAFYRAFVHKLLEWQHVSPNILVVPQYYRGDGPYERGRSWL